MAATGNSRKKTTSRKGSTKRTAAKRTKQQANHSVAASIILFALGVLLEVMVFVPGEAAWLKIREVLFGLVGVNFCALGFALMYFAVRVAQGEALPERIGKILLLAVFVSGAAVVFSKLETTGLAPAEVVQAYLNNGKDSMVGGGLLGIVLGGGLLALCGRPAANIIVVVLGLCAAMFVTGITPAELWEYANLRAGGARDTLGEAKENYRLRHAERKEKLREEQARAAQRREELDALRAERKQEQPEYPEESAAENVKKKRLWAGFFHHEEPEEAPAAEAAQREEEAVLELDFGADTAEPVEIGPGGTFGLEAVQQAQSAAQPTIIRPRQPAAPMVDEFNTPLAEPDVILPSGMARPAAAPAAAVPEKAVVPQPAAPEQDPFAGEGWISIGDTPAPSASIETLAAKAMDKPTAAENAAAAAPVVKVQQQAIYNYPPLNLFDVPATGSDLDAEAELKANAQKLVDTLDSFGVKTRVLDISRGPSVTRYELQPLAGVKISRITNLADDIALNLAVGGVRIEAPIPGKPAVGIEVPNRKGSAVSIRSIFESQNFQHTVSPLTMALGKDIAGVPQVGDLCKMPHLLIAGSTGSGKSVCVNSIIISFLYRNSPEDIKLIMIDPKVVELAEYNGIPHLLMPVVTEPRKAAGALGSAVGEMERRYRLFAENNVRDIKTYNKLARESDNMEKLPYIAIVIDELADLMMVSGKEVEDYICRIAQKARAAGMHLIVATQRPSVDVITGLIKANIPSRIAFAVSSQVDSRTILDGAGAEKLLGRGDMLFMPVGASKPIRIQGTYVTDEEITRTLDFIKNNSTASYNEAMIAEMEKIASQDKGGSSSGDDGGQGEEWDPMLNQCAEVVIDAGQASTSLLQRRCKLGYARAARIMDQMEQRGIIGPYEGAKPRAVLISRQQWLEMQISSPDPSPEQLTF